MKAEGAVVLRLSLLWIGWCFLHSLLITAKTNDWVRRRGGAVHGLSRLVYNLIATVTLVPLLWYHFSLHATTLFDWSGLWRLIQVFLLAYALVMAVAGKRSCEMGHFIGTRQWRDYRDGRKPAELPFRTTGALRWVRHPWYSGGIAFLWAFGPVTDVNLVGRLILSIYLVVGSVLEERKLLAEIGAPYAEYRRKVPMLLPLKYRVK
jgi:protein-S-isoprenylcysteine O-methyltransferase Ste14